MVKMLMRLSRAINGLIYSMQAWLSATLTVSMSRTLISTPVSNLRTRTTIRQPVARMPPKTNTWFSSSFRWRWPIICTLRVIVPLRTCKSIMRVKVIPECRGEAVHINNNKWHKVRLCKMSLAVVWAYLHGRMQAGKRCQSNKIM